MRAALLVLLACAPARALEWTPLATAQALGGAHSLSGQDGGASAELDGVFAAPMRLSPDWSLLPSWRSQYSGVRRIDDILGAGTVSQQRMEHRLGVRGVWAPEGSRWRLKPGASFKWSLLKETRDESWGEGLFDERRWMVGAEAELITREPHVARLGLDFYEALYPNYSTLESQAALQFAGSPVARELVGDHALDRRGVLLTLSGDTPLGERATGEAAVSAVVSGYPQQRVVSDDGQFEGRDRQDLLTTLSLTARLPYDFDADRRLTASCEASLSALSSNQNGYDASRGRFLPRFYDYSETKLAPSARLVFGPARRPVSLELGVGWRRRAYAHRPPQDESGAYRGGSLVTTEWSAAASLDYPMTASLALVARLERASASSNQRFERFYRYAYESLTTLVGVRWEWR